MYTQLKQKGIGHMYTQEEVLHLLENENPGTGDGDTYPLEFEFDAGMILVHVFCYGMQDASATIVMVITRCDDPLEVRRQRIASTLFLGNHSYDQAIQDMNLNASAWIVRQLNNIEG